MVVDDGESLFDDDILWFCTIRERVLNRWNGIITISYVLVCRIVGKSLIVS